MKNSENSDKRTRQLAAFSRLLDVVETIRAICLLAAEGADDSIDNVDHYNVFVDGKQAATATETSCLIKSVADGSHTLAVSAVYANGKESPQRQTSLDIAANSSVLPAVENVGVAVEGSSAIKATWQQPTDKDANTVTYAGKIPSSKGVVGPESNNYGLMAGAIYTPSMLKGYDGYRVKAVRFYPMGDAMFTVYIYKDNEQLCETQITARQTLRLLRFLCS